MILFLILLIVAMVALGVYAAQNTGTHDITLWNYHWTGVADWVPVVVAAGLMVVLFLVYMIYSGARSGLRRGALRRRITADESTITDVRKENQRLREENARLKSQLLTPALRAVQPPPMPSAETPAAVGARLPETTS